MTNYLKAHPTEITRKLVVDWLEHKRALQRQPLFYIDQLMDAIVAEEPFTAEELGHLLCRFVPGLPYGTARRLVNLKFNGPAANETLVAASKL